jgi:MFS family permease
VQRLQRAPDGRGAVQPYWMLATDMAPKQSGSLSGVMNFCGIIGATLAPVLSGFMAQSTHAFVLPFEVSALIFAVAAVALLAFVRVRPLTQLVEPSQNTRT